MGRSPMTAEEQMDVLCQSLDEGQLERTWKGGRALTMEQALGFPLGKTPG